MRGVLINTLLVLVSIIVTLIAADALLRQFSSIAPRSGQFTPEPGSFQRLNARTVTLSPNYRGMLDSRDFSRIPIQINALGFRDDEYDFDVLARSNPILFLGDSYVFGWGVRREKRLSELFSREPGPRAIGAPVLNMAIPGTGTYQALDLLKEFGLPLKPRLVVLGFFVGNDFLDNQAAAIIAPGEPAHGSDAIPGLKLIDAAEHSRAFSLRELIRSSPVVNLVKYGLWESRVFRRLFNRLEIQNDRIALYADQADDEYNRLYGPTLKALTEIAELTREAKIPLLILIIPDHLQLLEPQLFTDYDSQKPQRILAQHLSALGIPFVDLLPAFANASDPQQLFFREDKHWSVDGHVLVSRELLDPAMRMLAGDID